MRSSIKTLGIAALIGVITTGIACDIDRPIGQSGLVRLTRAQINYYMIALERYRADVGDYPSTAEGLEALHTAPGGQLSWKGPYLQKELENDAWGRPYTYRYPGRHGDKPDIVSYGRDGVPGGSGLDEDIASWALANDRPTL
jgi:general secretion pathway protein G